MPRLYVNPTELLESSTGIALAGQLSQLAPSVLEKLLFKASHRVDGHCRRRLQAPGVTILTQPVSVPATSISVASTLTLDNQAELAVTLNSGHSNEETLQIIPGGVTVSSYIEPFPGTITLATPVMFGHSAGESVTFAYKEIVEAGRASYSDPYTEALQSQAAQLALAHLPVKHAGLTRVVFTKNYPIISIKNIEHAYSFDNAWNAIDTSGISIEPTEGWYRMRVGQVIIPEGLVRTTYNAGFLTVNDDIKEATSYYLADEMHAFFNPAGAMESLMGKRRVKYSDGKSKALWVQKAEEILCSYRRMI